LWIMVGWYAYKGDLQSIKSWMKFVIWLAVGAVIFVYLFIGDINPIGIIEKHSVAVGAAIMLIPKIGLFYYCKNQLEKSIFQSHDDQSKLASPVIDFNQPIASIKENENNSKMTIKPIVNNNNQTNKINKDNNPEPLPEDWEAALIEYDGNDRNKGLWAKLFASSNGDENIVKAQYINTRAGEIASSRRKDIESRRSNIYAQASNEMCIKNGAINQIQANAKFPVYKLDNGNYAIYVSWRYKIYSSLDGLNKAIAMFNETELFSRDDFIEDVVSK